MTTPPPAPPVAFRLKRPYDDEASFLRGDGHGMSKSGMVLIGAGPRPVGVVVRFEVALRDGTALFRGEGRVVAHRAVEQDGKPAGLEVKFTRLDARGKALVEEVLRSRVAKPSPATAIPDLAPRQEKPPVIVPPPARSSDPLPPDDEAPTGVVPRVAAPSPTADDADDRPEAPRLIPDDEQTTIAPRVIPVAHVDPSPDPADVSPEPPRTETPTLAHAAHARPRRIDPLEVTMRYEFPLKPAPGSVTPPSEAERAAAVGMGNASREKALSKLRERSREIAPVERRGDLLDRLRRRAS